MDVHSLSHSNSGNRRGNGNVLKFRSYVVKCTLGSLECRGNEQRERERRRGREASETFFEFHATPASHRILREYNFSVGIIHEDVYQNFVKLFIIFSNNFLIVLTAYNEKVKRG